MELSELSFLIFWLVDISVWQKCKLSHESSQLLAYLLTLHYLENNMPPLTIAFFIGVLVWFALWILVHRHLVKQEKQIYILALCLILMWFGFHLYGFYLERWVPWMVDLLGGMAVGKMLNLGLTLSEIIKIKWGKD